MLRLAALVPVLLATFVPAIASEPGQPLDCEDFVFLQPGYTCSEWQRPADNSKWANFKTNEGKVFDNDGNLLRLDGSIGISTGCPGVDGWRVAILRFDGSTEDTVGYIETRCTPPGEITDSARPLGLVQALKFDPVHGRLLIPLTSSSNQGPTYYDWVAAIDGFVTLFDILQTYTPASSAISFRTPYMPEGFQYADYFDTFWGDLASVGDWSLAQPLRCGYPATAPSVGDYLTVEDTLPSPAPGRGYYYVTAVNFQGQRRYGRKANGGVLSGRDPAVLPDCAE